MPNEAQLESLALEVGFTTPMEIRRVLEDSPGLLSLKKLSVRTLESPTGADWDPVVALCAGRDIELGERVYDKVEAREREHWGHFTGPFGKLLLILNCNKP